jgi:hypothetical protein
MRSLFHGLVFSLLAATAGAAAAADINVLTAWYGQTCGAAHGNVTSHVKSRCDGKTQCDYLIDAGALGDPANGCAKNFVAMFTCSGKATVMLSQVEAEANGRVLQLSCAPPRAPIASPLK